MDSRNILLDLAYDGTDFHGWQIQRQERTVQGELERVLADLHGQRIPVHAAGRTDSGVHADQQRVNFHSAMHSIPADRFREALNSRLPLDMRVLCSREVPRRFHARYDAVLRIYEYQLLVSPVQIPRYRNSCHRINRTPDIGLLNRMASHLLGEHDFSSLGMAPKEGGHCVRRVESAVFFPRPPFLVFRIAANAFLWKMVRTIVGTILALEGGDPACAETEFVAILQARDRSRAQRAAPGRGLFLHKVLYHESYALD